MRYDKRSVVLTSENATDGVSWVVQGWQILGLDVMGTFTGAFRLRGTNNNQTWTTLTATSGETSINSAGHYTFDIAGFTQVKVEDAGGFDGSAALCALLTGISSTAALAAALAVASRSHRTVAHLEAPGNNLVAMPGIGGGYYGLTAVRYDCEQVAPAAAASAWLQQLFLSPAHYPDGMPDDLYLRCSLGDNVNYSIYPTLEDAQNETNEITSVAQVDVSGHTYPVRDGDGEHYGWVYASGTAAADGEIIRARRAEAESYRLDIAEGKDVTGMTIELQADLVVSNAATSDISLILGLFYDGFSNFGQYISITIPAKTASKLLSARIPYFLINGASPTSVLVGLGVPVVSLDGDPVAIADRGATLTSASRSASGKLLGGQAALDDDMSLIRSRIVIGPPGGSF